MAANTDSPRSPPLNDQVPKNSRLGIKILLGLPKHMPQQEMTPSPIAPDEDNDNFLGVYYQVDAESLDEWATVTSFMRGSIGFVLQEPEITNDFEQFLIKMYSSNWEKRVLGYQTMIIEQFYALITGYSRLTSRLKRAWLAQFDFCTPSQLRAQIKGPLSPQDFLNSSKYSGSTIGGAGINCVTYIFRFRSTAAL